MLLFFSFYCCVHLHFIRDFQFGIVIDTDTSPSRVVTGQTVSAASDQPLCLGEG